MCPKDIVDVLLQHGADVHHEDTQGATALIWAARSGHENIVVFLVENGADRADVNHRDSLGTTALNWAIALMPGSTDVVSFLGKRYGG